MQRDNLAGGAVFQVPDLGDPAVANAEIGAIPGIPHAIHDSAALQNQVEILGAEETAGEQRNSEALMRTTSARHRDDD